MRQGLIAQLFASIKKRGLRETVAYLAHELYFDHRYKSDTHKIVEVEDYEDVQASTKDHSQRYQAVPYYFLKRAYSRFAGDVKESVFLDYGCGKGRTMMLALDWGAAKVYGIDFSPLLCGICSENLQSLELGRGASFVVENQDATTYEIPTDVNCMFFFHPFGEPVLRQVFERIRETLTRNSRKITVLYYNPVFEDLFVETGIFVLRERIRQRNSEDDLSILVHDPSSSGHTHREH